ncbi:YdcF family protein [Methylomonas sp. MgM2]
MTILILLSLPIVSCNLARLLERIPPLDFSRVQQSGPQALVVIGGGLSKYAEYGQNLTVNTRTLARLRYAAILAKQFHLPVLVSGGRVFSSERSSEYPSEASVMAGVLEKEFNIPVAWKEPQSRNTQENARFSHDMLSRFGVKNIVLVTQAYHMPRALREFTRAGFTVLPAPTAFITDQWGGPIDFTIFDFLPSSASLMNSFLLAHESLGMLWYLIRY